jgi:hypothetical protein
MAEEAGRFSWVVKLSRLATFLGVAVIGAVAILHSALAVDMMVRRYEWVVWIGKPNMPPDLLGGLALACGVLFLLFMLVIALGLVALYGCVRTWVSAEDAAHTAASRIRTVETLLEDQAANSQKLVDLATLSDEARSLIYRDREIEAFRETVQADLTRQDYKAAAEHIEAIEKRFGYAEEAARLRKEAEESRKATVAEKLEQAFGRLQRIVDQRDWARAQREAQRIAQIFPEDPKVASLPQRIEKARLQTKRQLLAQYGEAVAKNDVEAGVRLLKELDSYLAPQEAAALAESARGIFHAKLVNMGVQFSIHVADERWEGALATGEEIVREFPNTKMAQEVREKLDLLRQRAAAKQAKA